MAVSSWVGIPSGNTHVVEIILGEDILIWWLFVLGSVREILWGEISSLGKGLPVWELVLVSIPSCIYSRS